MYAGHLHTHTHTHLYLLKRVHTVHVPSSLHSHPHMPSLYFLSNQSASYQNQTHFPPSKQFLYINTLNIYTLSPALRVPGFSSYVFFFLLRAFVKDQTNSRYLHPLGLCSHSTAVLWYRRAGKGTRLSLSGSLREHGVHLDRYLFYNVPRERPHLWESPGRLHHIFNMLICFVSPSVCVCVCVCNLHPLTLHDNKPVKLNVVHIGW